MLTKYYFIPTRFIPFATAIRYCRVMLTIDQTRKSTIFPDLIKYKIVIKYPKIILVHTHTS